MIVALSLALAQAATASADVPVVHDAPPQLLMAGYDQCLEREIDPRLAGQDSAEEIFDDSHAACAFWLDAYVAKIRSTLVTNIDYDAELERWLTALKVKLVPYIAEKQASRAAERDEHVARNQ